MIGQANAIKHIEKLVKSKSARFFIICGPEGSGKMELAKLLVKKLKAQLVYGSIKVDDVRELIELSYQQVNPTAYVFRNMDDMSIAAKNALLKVTEEPPQQAYFVMTVTQASTILPTLKSRGHIINLDPYTRHELELYSLERNDKLTDEELDVILDICPNTGSINKLLNYDILPFADFVNKVVSNIHTVSGPNAFKISTNIALTKKDMEENKKYDLTVFLSAVLRTYVRKLNTHIIQNETIDVHLLNSFSRSVLITNQYLQESLNKTINKQATFDMWCMQIRGVWLGET